MPNIVAQHGIESLPQDVQMAMLRATGGRAAGSLEAAADFLGPGAIEINIYEKQIFDIVRRKSKMLSRIMKPLATGAPHRYFEQTAIATAQNTDPRNIATTPTSPTRVERSAVIKAFTAQTNFSTFDVWVTKQQGQYASLEAQDIDDITSAIVVLEATELWTGTDTSLTVPTTQQFVGLLTQITQQATIAPGYSIIDFLKQEVAVMANNATYDVQPTAIAVDLRLGDFIDREAKASHIELATMDIAAGVKVNALVTQAGLLPLIPDVYLGTAATTGAAYGFSAAPAGKTNRFAVILTEDLIEMPYIGPPGASGLPQIFQLGLLGGLQGQFVGIHFPTLIAKGPSYGHAVVCVQTAS